jgi:hypothetical protein
LEIEEERKKGRIKKKAYRSRRKKSRKKKILQVLVLFCPPAKSQRTRKV